jgi:hypothetical protein
MSLTTLLGRARSRATQICWGSVTIPGRNAASLSMWKTQDGYEVRLSQGSSTDTLASVTDVYTCYKLMLLIRTAIQLGTRAYSKAATQLLCALQDSHQENAANVQAFVNRDTFLRVSRMTLADMPQEIQDLAKQ